MRFLVTPFYREYFYKIGLWAPNQTAMLMEEGLKGWIREGIHPPTYTDFVADYLPKHGVTMRFPPRYLEASNDYLNPAFEAIGNGEMAADVMPDAARAANEALLAAKENMQQRHIFTTEDLRKHREHRGLLAWLGRLCASVAKEPAYYILWRRNASNDP